MKGIVANTTPRHLAGSDFVPSGPLTSTRGWRGALRRPLFSLLSQALLPGLPAWLCKEGCGRCSAAASWSWPWSSWACSDGGRLCGNSTWMVVAQLVPLCSSALRARRERERHGGPPPHGSQPESPARAPGMLARRAGQAVRDPARRERERASRARRGQPSRWRSPHLPRRSSRHRVAKLSKRAKRPSSQHTLEFWPSRSWKFSMLV